MDRNVCEEKQKQNNETSLFIFISYTLFYVLAYFHSLYFIIHKSHKT